MSLASQVLAAVTQIGAAVKADRARLDKLEAGRVRPSDYGFKDWTFDPALSSTAGSLTTAGTLHLTKIYNDVPGLVVNSVSLYVTASGVSLTNVGVGLWAEGAAGARLAASVNANGATTAAFTAAPGEKVITFSTPPAITGNFYVGFWTTGTTQPTIMRASTLGGINVGLAINSSRFATAGGGLTTTAPANLGTIAQNAVAWWAGVK